MKKKTKKRNKEYIDVEKNVHANNHLNIPKTKNNSGRYELKLIDRGKGNDGKGNIHYYIVWCGFTWASVSIKSET